MGVKEDIQKTVQENCVVMYSKSTCPYCVKARKALESTGVQYLEIDLNSLSNTAAYQDALQDITGKRSVPRVFVGGACIGGGDETAALHRRGRLEPLLQSCHAPCHAPGVLGGLWGAFRGLVFPASR